MLLLSMRRGYAERPEEGFWKDLKPIPGGCEDCPRLRRVCPVLRTRRHAGADSMGRADDLPSRRGIDRLHYLLDRDAEGSRAGSLERQFHGSRLTEVRQDLVALMGHVDV